MDNKKIATELLKLAKAVMSGDDKVFTLFMRMYKGATPQPQFSFHAEDEKSASDKAKGWARYHSFQTSDVSVEPAKGQELTEDWIHDEYVKNK